MVSRVIIVFMPRKKATKQSSSSISSSKSVPAKRTSVKKTTTPVKPVQAKRSTREKVETQKPLTSLRSQAPVNETLKTNLRNPRLWVGVAVVLLAILLYAGRGILIAAMVNGQPISRLAVIQQLEKQAGKDALNGLIGEVLIQQEAQKEHVAVSQSEVDASEAQIANALKSQGTNLNDALAARGMTKQQLDNQIALDKMLTKMVGKNVKVTDQQVQDYINANQSNLPQGLSDDQLKAQVKQQLEQQQLTTLKQQFVDNLQKKASIQTFVNY